MIVSALIALTYALIRLFIRNLRPPVATTLPGSAAPEES
jgi:hypothetical protein